MRGRIRSADQEGRLRFALLFALGLGITASTLAPASLPADWIRYEKDPYARLLASSPPSPQLGFSLEKNSVVSHVVFGSGADKAGLEPGDLLEKFDMDSGKIRYRRKGKSHEVSVARGLKGAPVKAKIVDFADGSREGRIAIEAFEGNTCELVARAVEQMASVNALELDLRNNPGGALEEAACVGGIFLGDGQPFAYLEGLEGAKTRELRLTKGSQLTVLPLRVRVNSRSASSAEILAAALQDSGRALLVGQHTFGKGSVQTFRQVAAEPPVWLEHTSYQAYRMDGRAISLSGIQPSLTQ